MPTLEASELLSQPESPQRIVNTFVTRIWRHPLITPLTEQKRTEAVAFLNQRMQDIQRGLVFVPVGGIRWIAGESSDVDLLIYADGRLPQLGVSAIELMLKMHRLAGALPTLDHVGTHVVPPMLTRSDVPALAELFLVPDEYIAGDHAFLHALRRKLLYRKNYRQGRQAWIQNDIDTALRQRVNEIKRWPVDAFADVSDVHTLPFLTTLFARAYRSHNPDAYLAAWYKNVRLLEPPTYTTIRSAMEQSGGEIHIDHRYAADI